MVGEKSIFKVKLLSIIGAIALFGVMLSPRVQASNVNIGMEVCNGLNVEPTVTLNYANNATVFVSPVSLNFLTNWVYQVTTSRGGTQLAQSTINFEANQSFSQSINLVVGANALTIVTSGGCPRHNVTQTLNLNYNPNGISVNHITTPNSSPALTGLVGINNHNIKVTINGQTYDATNNGDGTWTLPAGTISPALPNGTYDVQLQLLDAATNAPLNNVNETGAVVINHVAPTLTANPVVTNQTSPALTGTISSATSQVQVIINGQTYNATNNGDGTWTLPAGTIQPALADGSYNITVNAINPNTNVVEATVTLSPGVRIDTIAPQVTINTTETDQRQPELTGTTDDATAVITVQINGQTYAATNNGDGTWTLPAGTIQPLASGDYDVVVTARDAAGNSTTANVVLKVKASNEPGFILPPMTGYIRINRTNIPSWLLYLILIAVIAIVVRVNKQRRLAKAKTEA